MSEHPIQGLMKTTMENLKGMVDVNTILGKPVSTPDGSVILTVSKVAFGFGAGGSDFEGNVRRPIARPHTGHHAPAEKELEMKEDLPFGGGSGAGVAITPVAFLVVGAKGVQVMHLHSGTHLIEKAIDVAPQAISTVQTMFDNNASKQNNNESLM